MGWTAIRSGIDEAEGLSIPIAGFFHLEKDGVHCPAIFVDGDWCDVCQHCGDKRLTVERRNTGNFDISDVFDPKS